jgi:hypothetical protein
VSVIHFDSHLDTCKFLSISSLLILDGEKKKKKKKKKNTNKNSKKKKERKREKIKIKIKKKKKKDKKKKGGGEKRKRNKGREAERGGERTYLIHNIYPQGSPRCLAARHQRWLQSTTAPTSSTRRKRAYYATTPTSTRASALR